MEAKVERIVNLDPTTRHEGHAKLVLHVDEEGIVERAYYLSTTMVRSFESLTLGRTYEFTPRASMRICGLCPVSHAVASCQALEFAFELEIPPDALILREILGLASKMQDHALHQFLILNDLVDDEKIKKESVENLQEMRRIGQKMKDIVGGEAIHPSNYCVGGFRTNVSQRAAASLYRLVRKYEKNAHIQKDLIIESVEKKLENLPNNIGVSNSSIFATHMTYGDKKEVNLEAIREVIPSRFYGKDEEGRNTNTMIPLYYGETVETGPRARFIKFKRFSGDSALYINVARAREMLVMVYRAEELLDQLDVDGKTKPDHIIVKEGEGVGVYEAPRGTLIHMAKTDHNGIMRDYKIISPTTWNIPTIGKAIEGSPQEFAEVIMRSYDPCLDCATHCIIVKNLKGEVIERRYL